MDLMQLQYFLKVADCEHITRAARELYLTPPAVSRSIAALEEELGVPLFDRTGNSVRLNTYGRILTQYAKRLFITIEDAKRELSDASDNKKTSITLSVPYGTFISSFAQEFLLSHPNVQYTQLYLSADRAKDSLLDGRIDYAITLLPIRDAGIEWEHLFYDSIYIMSNNDFLLGKPRSLPVEHLMGQRFILNNLMHDFMSIFLSYCETAGFKCDSLCQISESSLTSRLIQEGYGVAPVPRNMFVLSEIASRRFRQKNSGSGDQAPQEKSAYANGIGFPLTELIFPDECPHLELGIARRRGHYYPSASVDFYNQIIAFFQDMMRDTPELNQMQEVT